MVMNKSLIIGIIVLIASGAFIAGKVTAHPKVVTLDKAPYGFDDYSDGVVHVHGNLVVKDETGNVLEGDNDPTNVNGNRVDLICNQSSMTCLKISARMLSSDGIPISVGPITSDGLFISFASPFTYELDQWTDNTIVSKQLSLEDNCTIEILTIDRASKTAIITNKLSNTSGKCASLPSKMVTETIQ